MGVETHVGTEYPRAAGTNREGLHLPSTQSELSKRVCLRALEATEVPISLMES